MFYSGFALENEAHFFDAWFSESLYTVSGFSYGAIVAFEKALASSTRVDTLQLFSPAFFQNRSEKYKKLQLMGYQKNSAVYIEKFTQNCFKPYPLQALNYSEHTLQELEVLLGYVWTRENLETLKAKGTKIEVYLGGQDKINDSEGAYEFFKAFATVTLIKDANHFLQGETDERD